MCFFQSNVQKSPRKQHEKDLFALNYKLFVKGILKLLFFLCARNNAIVQTLFKKDKSKKKQGLIAIRKWKSGNGKRKIVWTLDDGFGENMQW